MSNDAREKFEETGCCIFHKTGDQCFVCNFGLYASDRANTLFDPNFDILEIWIAANPAEINHKDRVLNQKVFLNHDGIINLSVAITHDNYTRTHKFVMSAKDGSVLISETEK